MDNIKEIWCINLSECKNRLQHFDNNMKNLGLKYIRFSAIKGCDLDNHMLSKYTSYLCRHFTCSYGIIGCYLSHFFLWKQLQTKENSNLSWYFILEDDSIINRKCINNINNIFNDILNWNFTENKPEYINCASTISPKIKKITDHLYTGIFVNGTSAYLINTDGINKLVRNMNKAINYHIDLTISIDNLIFNDLSYYITNNYVNNIDNLTSTISNTYPRLIPDLINWVSKIFNVNNHFHIVYDSSLLVFQKTLSINIFIIPYTILIALLITKRKFMLCIIIMIIEIIWDIINLLNKNKIQC